MRQNDRGDWPFSGSLDACKVMGAQVIERDVTDVQIDPTYKIVTTPAFMKTASYYEVFIGIGKMIESVLRLTA